jgi:hypothetical protein
MSDEVVSDSGSSEILKRRVGTKGTSKCALRGAVESGASSGSRIAPCFVPVTVLSLEREMFGRENGRDFAWTDGDHEAKGGG